MRRYILFSVALLFVLASLLEFGSVAQGSPQYTTIYSFTGKNGDAAEPSGPVLLDSEGAIYGTSTAGGGGPYQNQGTVFKFTPPPGSGGAWTESILHDFTGGADGDAADTGVLFGPGGVLYGTTAGGGASPYGGSFGTVFELTPPSGGGWTHTVLYSFQGGTTGSYPGALVLAPNGALYGAAYEGGPRRSAGCPGVGCGLIFELTEQAGTWHEMVLHSFAYANGDNPNTPLVLGSDGTLYGTTAIGGPTGGGVVFALKPSGSTWTYTILHTFAGGGGNDGDEPSYGLVSGPNGVLYGVTYIGGPGSCNAGQGCGTVFEMSPASGGGWTEKVLYSFAGGNDGSEPVSLILGDDGNLYGTTFFGGSSNCYEGCGTVFELSPDAGGGWTETVLYRWTASSRGSAVAFRNGVLYGTVFVFGASNLGSVFTLVP